mmetsp:Transcript_64993/g.136170  ORF Transcript_64993/g.136170 Transcript_64993/m.136170 type:complete len:685 (-) Transcript_64993:36-2090(-)|eukprot:CAMPEP_0206572320 /NCGR_PEP_ID=MMETSP0325_2-20121206/28171_1 /ASSEMBLY_ACC=CAM_ASM_000347 /TAXON_ID=2866 /ORGANISM="Crypthecodinium cohnii, Strain Seligo" /LENGTH=684 /DNA_ID=CAMNT_0054076493 /DNA_START=66 /DNA_END=2120 /DNA_ORIENTATION=-
MAAQPPSSAGSAAASNAPAASASAAPAAAAAGAASTSLSSPGPSVPFMHRIPLSKLYEQGKNEEGVEWTSQPVKEPVGGDPEEIGVFPLDEANAALLNNIAPRKWHNPQAEEFTGSRPGELYFDIVAIGAGAGGLVSAKQSARRGLKSALIEKHLAGGDCLNVGCVPSKALLRCARAVREARVMSDLGISSSSSELQVDFGRVMARMRQLRAKIAPADALSTSAAVGAHCFFGSATFQGRQTLRVDYPDLPPQMIHFGKAVIATGASAAIPDIRGLEKAPYHTNASLYNLTEKPQSMVIIGSGPIGMEMAQAFSLFGTKVTVLSRSRTVLPREDPEAAAVVRESLEKDGVRFLNHLTYERVEVVQNSAKWTPSNPCNNGNWPELRVVVKSKATNVEEILSCDCLLVAAGRRPNLQHMNLGGAAVEYDKVEGIKVNDFLQTTNPNIYAVGDVCSKHKFTHVSGMQAQIAVENALFGGSRTMSSMAVPQVTYTEPEVAHVGAYEYELSDCDTYRSMFEHNDRAILEGKTEGFVKVCCRRGTEEILGATIVGTAAGEMISELTLAIQFGIPLGVTGLGKVIHPYPTLSDGVGGCAHQCKMKSWRKAVVDPSNSTYRIYGGPKEETGRKAETDAESPSCEDDLRPLVPQLRRPLSASLRLGLLLFTGIWFACGLAKGRLNGRRALGDL